jgi:hypothetical protein
MLSAAKHLARGAQRCFAALSMTAKTPLKAAQVLSQEKSSLQTSAQMKKKLDSEKRIWYDD